MEKVKVDSKKLQLYDRLLVDLWSVTQKLTAFYKELTEQEQALAGGVIVQVHSAWSSNRMSVLIGEFDQINALINQAIHEAKRPPDPTPPPFIDPKKEFN